MRKLYRYDTRIGAFYIAEREGRFHAVFGDESLGSYTTPQQAVDDLAGGHTDWPSSGVDPSTLGLPRDVADWERLSR